MFLLLCIPVYAQLSIHAERGGDRDGSYNNIRQGTETFNFVTPSGSNNGTSTDLLVFDITGNGKNEVITQGPNGQVIVRDAKNPTGEISSIAFGELRSQPVACDVNNDGVLDYVAIHDLTNASLGQELVAYTLNPSASLEQIGSQLIKPNSTDKNFDIRCDRFFAKQGDARNYVLYVNHTKHLFISLLSGTGFTQTVVDVDPGLFTPSAVENEADVAFTPFKFGTGQLIISDDFSPSGSTALFIAGDRIYGRVSNGDEIAYDYEADVGTSYNLTSEHKTVQLMAGVLTSSGGVRDRLALLLSGDNKANQVATSDVLYILRFITGGFFTSDRIDFESIKSTGINANCTGSCLTDNVLSSAMARADLNNDGISDIAIMSFNSKVNDKGDLRCPVVHVLSTHNMSLLTQIRVRTSFYNGGPVLGDACGDMDQSDGFDFQPRISVADFDGDGVEDVVYTNVRSSDGSGTSIEFVNLSQGIFNFSRAVLYPATLIQDFNGTSVDSIMLRSPIAVDMNQDGRTDLVYSHPGLTSFLLSTVIETTADNFPFRVRFNNSKELESIQIIDVKFNDSRKVYTYAVACNINQDTVFSERFTFGYNFSNRNVSLDIRNGSGDLLSEKAIPDTALLTFEGITVDISNDTTRLLSLFKSGNKGAGGEITMTYDFIIRSANRSIQMLMFSDDSDLFDFILFNKTGANIEIREAGFSNRVIGTTTDSSLFYRLVITYRPIELFPPVPDLYGRETVLNGVLINNSVDSRTSLFPGENIRDTQIFVDDTEEGEFTIREITLREGESTEPEFIVFQNGQKDVISGVTVTSGGTGRESGDGFQVNSLFNFQFASICKYREEGEFIQRHYMTGAGNTSDYTNPVDLTVTVASDVSLEGQAGFMGEDLIVTEATEDLIDELFGNSGTVTKFLVFAVASFLIIGAIWVHVSPMLAVGVVPLILLVGFSLGLVQFWIVITLFIFASLSIVVMYRKFFGGAGS